MLYMARYSYNNNAVTDYSVKNIYNSVDEFEARLNRDKSLWSNVHDRVYKIKLFPIDDHSTVMTNEVVTYYRRDYMEFPY